MKVYKVQRKAKNPRIIESETYRQRPAAERAYKRMCTRCTAGQYAGLLQFGPDDREYLLHYYEGR